VDIGFLESQGESSEVMDSFAFGFEVKNIFCLKTEDALGVCVRDVSDRFLVWKRLKENIFYLFSNDRQLIH